MNGVKHESNGIYNGNVGVSTENIEMTDEFVSPSRSDAIIVPTTHGSLPLTTVTTNRSQPVSSVASTPGIKVS